MNSFILTFGSEQVFFWFHFLVVAPRFPLEKVALLHSLCLWDLDER